MNRVRIITSIFIYLIALSLYISADIESWFEDLNLSREQQQKISEMTRGLMDFRRDNRMELNDLKSSLNALKYSPYATSDEYNKAVDRLKALNIEWENAKVDYYFSVGSLLNQDQREDFADIYFDEDFFNKFDFPNEKRGDNGNMDMNGFGPGDGGEGQMPGGRQGGQRGFGMMQGGGPDGMKKLGVYSRLDLTKDQKTVIEDILDQQKAIKDEVEDSIEERNEQIEKMMIDKNSDPRVILSKIEERENKKSEIDKVLYLYDLRILQILTVEQRKELFDYMINSRKERFGDRPGPDMMPPQR